MYKFVAKQIVAHVRNGGFLGAAWPSYVPGADHALVDLAKAISLAEELHPQLWYESNANFVAKATEWQARLYD